MYFLPLLLINSLINHSVVITATFNDCLTIAGNVAVSLWELVRTGFSTAVFPDPSPLHSPLPAASVQVLPKLSILSVFSAIAGPQASSTDRHRNNSQGLSSVPCISNAQPVPGVGPWVASQLLHALGAWLGPGSPQPANVPLCNKHTSPPSPVLSHFSCLTQEAHLLLHRRLCPLNN